MIGTAGLIAAAMAAFAGGSVNAVSGGGTLITFPVLLWLGVPSIAANATSTIALWPGVLSSMWGYRKELEGARKWALLILAPCLAGGLLGAFLLLGTRPKQFDRIAPFLVLGATLLFMSHSLISRLIKSRSSETGDADPQLTPGRTASYLLFQFLIAIYGGYFGAGMGIVILAAFGIMGLKNIHRMNGLKNWCAFVLNGVAIVVFVLHRLIDWPVALVMAAGAIAGGYMGAILARRVGQVAVRRIIIGVGFAATISLLFRTF